MRKFLAMMLSLVMVLGLMVPMASAAEEPVAKSDDIVLLTTNDVHCHIDNDIGYATLAGLRDQLKEEYNNVFLLDAGNHAQGTAFGSMDKGKTMIELMNTAKYDVATLGNHEFDYDQEGCINITDKWAKFPYVSCNFYEEKDGERGDYVVDPYVILPLANGKTLAVVGITTPETFTKSTPAYFQDENGEYIYGISGGKDGKALYADVQKAIDDATEAGADYVQAFEGGEVKADNSPLNLKYDGFGVDYAEVTGSGRIAVYDEVNRPADPEPEIPEVDPEDKPDIDPEEKPEVDPEQKPEEKPESPETGDTSVMLYADLAVVAVAGAAVVLKKKGQF